MLRTRKLQFYSNENVGLTRLQSTIWLPFFSMVTLVPVLMFVNSPTSLFLVVEFQKSDPRLEGERPLAHDDPSHPWHWTRSNGLPSKWIGRKRDCKGTLYVDHYKFFHTNGYTIFDSCSLQRANDTTLIPASEYTASLSVSREDNADNPAVKQISVDPDTIAFIQYLHGERPAFPFQTLNFPTPTQQPLHSDLIHFDTWPRMMMAAAWVALEDVGSDNGPLAVVPGSHLRGTWDFEEVGLRNKTSINVTEHRVYNDFYGEELSRLVAEDPSLAVEHAKPMKYGQTLIWAAGLLHGGAPQLRPSSTRLSQVTHYFFEGADYHWVPRLSNPELGKFHKIGHISPCLEQDLFSCSRKRIQRWVEGEPIL